MGTSKIKVTPIPTTNSARVAPRWQRTPGGWGKGSHIGGHHGDESIGTGQALLDRVFNCDGDLAQDRGDRRGLNLPLIVTEGDKNVIRRSENSVRAGSIDRFNSAIVGRVHEAVRS